MGDDMSILLAAALALVAAAGAPVRAVVQQSHPIVLAVSDERKGAGYAVCGEQSLTGTTHPLIHVLDLKTQRIIQTTEFEQRIDRAVISPSGAWALLTGTTHIYRFDLFSGEYEVMFRNFTGAAAISADESIIVLLGQETIEPSLLRPGNCQLRVFDTAKHAWLSETTTSIVIPQAVSIEGDQIVAFGKGGRLYSRLQDGFFCLQTSNWKTGEQQEQRSPLRFDASSDVPPLMPAKFVALKKLRETTQRRILHSPQTPGSDRIMPRVTLGYTKKFMAVEDAGELHVVLNRWAGGDRGDWSALHVTIDADGEIRHKSFADAMNLHVSAGQPVHTRYGFDMQPATNLISGEEFALPRFDREDQGWIHHTFAGDLVYRDKKLALYRPQKESLAWSTDETIRWFRAQTAASGNGKFIAIAKHDRAVVQVRDATTGKMIRAIARENDEDRYLRGLALSHSGDKLAITEERLRVFRVATGELFFDEPIERKSYISRSLWLGDDVLLGGGTQTTLYRPDTGSQKRFNLGEALFGKRIVVRREPCVLIESRRGDAVVLQEQTGKQLGSWVVGRHQSTSGWQLSPPRAMIAFQGRLLVRQVSDTGRIALMQCSDLSTVATVVPIPIDRGKIGWVITTPDGYWTASSEIQNIGTNQYISLFRGHEALSSEEAKEFESPAIVRDRLRQAIAGQSHHG